MPVVDRVVVLDTRISALPGCLADLLEQRLGIDSLDDLASGAGTQTKFAAFFHGTHELIAHTDRVVGVLVLNADDVLATEIHIEPGIAQNANLALLGSLRLHELLDIGMVDIQNDHLRGPTSGTTGLDRAGRGICTPHERDRATGGTAGGEQFLGRADAAEIQPRTRATLEDQPLLAVPVQNRVHGVVDGENETGRYLLWAGGAHVEPDRGVKREDLVQQHPGEFMLEDLRILVGEEVAEILTSLGVGEHHSIDQLAKTPLPGIGTQGTTEVLGGDDRGCIYRPELGELNATLLENGFPRLPVGLHDITVLPGDLVVRVNAGRGVDALNGQTCDLWTPLLRRRAPCASRCLGHNFPAP